ncbi:ornithine cyclodeaminase [Halopseudomonas litoralis]|uniref:Ornithine cyclodeaminase n=1 Tax=Halopseudomonas litoralis TaxID=797277 RepID=A0A1H1QFM5_9GAMM|nr:ornithine cyclodeaminase [Halopseudomonas litoralis]SDS22113.1 ornithine cyclodeaminase [Halopseudomonas litoralis]
MRFISAEEISAVVSWDGVLNALYAAHQDARPLGDNVFVGDTDYGLFTRSVVLPGLGAGVKVSSIYPANSMAVPAQPTEQAVFLVIDEQTKAIAAILDGPTITRWKTAADSALAAQRLSRDDSRVLLALGSGPIAQALVEAYLHIRPSIDTILLWNRTTSRLTETHELLQRRGIKARIVTDLDAAVTEADIITSATSSTSPLIRGALIQPGTHIDLVGGFRPDMREADDDAARNSRIFVGDHASAVQSGDLHGPLKTGIISAEQIELDLYGLCQQPSIQRADEDITLYKNAGGAHLDLIVAQHVLSQLKSVAA